MRLSSLWEMGPFSDLAGSVYISTHKSFDSLGEDCSDPDSWYIHMLLLQEDKLVSQNLWGRPLSIFLWEMKTVLPTFICSIFLTGFLRNTVKCQVWRDKDKKNKHSYSLFSVPNFIKPEKISRVTFFFFITFKTKKKFFLFCFNLQF